MSQSADEKKKKKPSVGPIIVKTSLRKAIVEHAKADIKRDEYRVSAAVLTQVARELEEKLKEVLITAQDQARANDRKTIRATEVENAFIEHKYGNMFDKPTQILEDGVVVRNGKVVAEKKQDDAKNRTLPIPRIINKTAVSEYICLRKTSDALNTIDRAAQLMVKHTNAYRSGIQYMKENNTSTLQLEKNNRKSEKSKPSSRKSNKGKPNRGKRRRRKPRRRKPRS